MKNLNISNKIKLTIEQYFELNEERINSENLIFISKRKTQVM